MSVGCSLCDVCAVGDRCDLCDLCVVVVVVFLAGNFKSIVHPVQSWLRCGRSLMQAERLELLKIVMLQGFSTHAGSHVLIHRRSMAATTGRRRPSSRVPRTSDDGKRMSCGMEPLQSRRLFDIKICNGWISATC